MSNQTQSNISERNSEDNDNRESINDGEEDSFNSSIPASASTYVYRDYSQERSEPTWFDQRFENLLQTADQKRKLPAKLNTILSDPELSSIITWLPHGRSWRIVDRQNFINHVLPPHFGHNKHASFIRLVNAWGFRRIPSGVDKDSYFHELFLRGMPHLHKRMRRLVFHESKAPIHDENWFPNFYEMPLLDEVANAPAPVQHQQNSAICDSTSSNCGIVYPPSNPSRSEGSSSASTSTAPAILGIGLPKNQIYNQQVINSLKMAFQAQQQLMSNSNNPALPLPSGANPLLLQNFTNTSVAAQPSYASLMQAQYQQRPQQYQQHGQQMNDFQSSTNDGHQPYQGNGSVDQASSNPGHGAIASTTYHIQLEEQQHSQAGVVPTVFVPGEGANALSNCKDHVTPGTTPHSLQQQQMLQVQLQQNFFSSSSNQDMEMRPLFIQAVKQQQNEGLVEAGSRASGPDLSFSATPQQLNSLRSMARVQTQSSTTVSALLKGGISISSGEEIVDYPGFIATASHDRFSSQDSSAENSLSIKRTLPEGHLTLSRNDAQKTNDEKAPDTSSDGKQVQRKHR